MFPRDPLGWRGGQMGQCIKGGRLRVVRKRGVNLRHCLFPPPDSPPIVGRVRVAEERCGGLDEKPLALGRRPQRFGRPHRLPSLAQFFTPRPCRPQRLEQRHRDSPVGHRAVRVDRGDSLESFPRRGIGHVVEQGDGAIELQLRAGRATDREIDSAQGLGSRRLLLVSDFGSAARKQ